jgi:hypothetical protein
MWIVMETVRKYSVEFSFDSFNPDHGYSRTEKFDMPAAVMTLEQAIAWVHASYKQDSSSGWVGLWISETVGTVSTFMDVSGCAVRRTEVLERSDVHAEYRTAESYSKFYLDSQEDETVEYELWLQDAAEEEAEENLYRSAKHEPQVFDAYLARCAYLGEQPDGRVQRAALMDDADARAWSEDPANPDSRLHRMLKI